MKKFQYLMSLSVALMLFSGCGSSVLPERDINKTVSSLGDAPKPEVPAVMPVAEAPAVEVPAIMPEVEAPAVMPEVEVPAVMPEVEAPAVETEVEAPAVETEVEAPVVETGEEPSVENNVSETTEENLTVEAEMNVTMEIDFVITPKKFILTEIQKDVIRLHNENRKNEFEDSDLSYSLELEKAAQKYADELALNGKFEHDRTNHVFGYGENLFADTLEENITIEKAMEHWYTAEKEVYDYDTGICNDKELKDAAGNVIVCGHYTQVVWQKSKEVGCAVAKYTTGKFENGFVYVCKYKEAGNVVGEKAYCTTYSNRDIYVLDENTTFEQKVDINSSLMTKKEMRIELVDENRTSCVRVDNENGKIFFEKSMKSLTLKDFDVFNGSLYTGTFIFDNLLLTDNVIKAVGKSIDGKNNTIYIIITFIAESDDYYSVTLEWNGVDIGNPIYTRTMKSKLYK